MTTHIRDILGMQREIELARKQVLSFEESSIFRIAKEAQQAFLQQQRLIEATISPLREEMARHQKMMDEIKAVQFRFSENFVLSHIKSMALTDELLRNHRVLDEVRALTRPDLAFDLQKLLPDRSIWQHIHEQQATFESVRLQAALVSQAFRDIGWAQQLVTQPTLYAVQHINQTANLITRWEQIGRPIGPLAASIACTSSFTKALARTSCGSSM